MIFEKQNEQSRIKIKESTIKNSIANFLVDNISYKSLVYIVMLVFISSVNILGVYPGIFVMLGVASVFEIPLIITLVFTGISMLIFSLPVEVCLVYIITLFIYLILTGIINIEGISKKIIVMIKIFASMLLSVMIVGAFKKIELEYIYSSIAVILLSLIGYIIFSSGINVLFNFGKKIIYSVEELISLSLMLGIMFLFLRGINIFGISIFNSILVIIALITGYIGGWFPGLITGTLFGITMMFQNNIESAYIIIFLAFVGTISGITQTKNKIIIALINITIISGFECIFSKAAGLSTFSIQVLVATVILMFLPRKLIYNLKNIFNRNNALGKPYEKELGPGIDVLDRMGAIEEVFEGLSKISLEPSEVYLKETENVIGKYLINYAKNECIKCNQINECKKEGKKYSVHVVAKNISEKLENNLDIKEDVLGNNCINAMEILKEIKDIYNNMKLMRIIKAKEKEASINRAEEYRQISHVIKAMNKIKIKKINNNTTAQSSKIAKNIKQALEIGGFVVYEDEYTFDLKEKIKTYEFVTDIIEVEDKNKENIRKIVSAIISEEMNIKIIMNSSKNESSRIRLVSKKA